LERGSFAVDVKFGYGKVEKVREPIVFVSNYSPYADHSFLRRLAVIEALENLENMEKVLVPKEEVDGAEEMEVVEVPSGSESDSTEEIEVDEYVRTH
jgi:hypothetical protein